MITGDFSFLSVSQDPQTASIAVDDTIQVERSVGMLFRQSLRVGATER